MSAENRIDEAIVEHVRTESPGDVVTGWVVLVAVAAHDGESRSGVHTIYPGGELPWPMALGIVRMGTLRIEADFLAGES